MGRAAIDQLLYAMDRAWGSGDPDLPRWHTLLGNLGGVSGEDWLWVPPGGKRSIFSILHHMGAKYVWDSQAFGDRSIHWEWPLYRTVTPQSSREDVIAYLRGAHENFRAHVDALGDDEELAKPRLTPQGPMRETRFIITTMIEHDLYHTGEINHIRALRQGDQE